jgi:hypothetical protein
MAKEKENTELSERKDVINKAYPEGKVVKFNERVTVKCKKDTPGGMIKGQEYEMHPTTATQLREQGIVE